jgi:glycosyltransferase involved in cell wall biosynthesis
MDRVDSLSSEDVRLSLVIPAHNEEHRLGTTLSLYAGALQATYGAAFEIIVVANGCSDRTAEVARSFEPLQGRIRVIDIAEPIGKGRAVVAGLRAAHGAHILFADADAATSPESLLALADGLDSADVVIGSRWLPDSVITKPQPLKRRAFSRLFNAAVVGLFGLPFADTQCGAKAFRRPAAKQLAAVVRESRWTFDVDLLLWARFLGLRVVEMPVTWADQPGSHLAVGATAREVAASLLHMKLRSLRPHGMQRSWERQRTWERRRPVGRKAGLLSGKLTRETDGRPLRILALNWRCLSHPQAGGSEVNIFEQARRWVKSGHQVTIITADPGREYAPDRVDDVDGIIVRRMGNRLTVYPRALLYYLTHRRAFDGIVDVANGVPFFSALLPVHRGVLLVHHVHGRQWFTEFPFPVALVGSWLERRFVPWLYRKWPVIAVSPTTRDALLGLGYAPDRVSVVYNGMDMPEQPQAIRPQQHRIAYVGRIKRYKRLDRLVRAVAELRHEVPDVHLDVVGDGDALSELKGLAAELGLNGAVTFHGFVDEQKKAEVLAGASVFATPSMHEGWGLSVIEANAHGVPAVAFNVPGLSVAIRSGETGLLAEDEAGFRHALELILCDPGLRDRLSAEARAWAARFDWDDTARETLNLLQQELAPATEPVRA